MEINVTGSNFEQEIINSDIPVLVDFWAPWCGPCKMIAPFVEEIAQEFAGKVKVCKINIDDASDIATKLTVMSIPTIMVFKGGNIMDKKVGAMDKDALIKLLHPYLV